MLYFRSFNIVQNDNIVVLVITDKMEESCNGIPVLDFESLGLHRKRELIDKKELKIVGDRVKDAFTKAGFCYLKNHGIDQNLVSQYMDISRGFFEQPVEEKMKHVRGTDSNFGWVAVERESLNPERPGDLKEAFNYQPADDPDDWPTAEFQQASRDMYLRCTELSHRVCDALSVGLDLGEDFMRNAHQYIGTKENSTALRSLYYPPVPPESSIKPGQIRLGEHSDYGTITLVFQDDIGGLEVNIQDKGFVPATPIPGTVVVNIGDLMQRWTADQLIATKHRVLIPEVEFKKRKHRQSIAFFVHPDNNYMIECLDGSKKYEPISGLDYLNYRFSLTY
ncbi:uncharacterized protein LOC132715659 isoform X2 [Ruditapes philippinarum]|uniref:uncharacterized protein LOC132715659 isoform X2 n=1 Tax=Ruditapes philippinarum TaxID=129788 RepID=UPI00295B84D0|nr:uncharacterized protein LOC132715659 isoform X2 [Ruditapes philippinarum]